MAVVYEAKVPALGCGTGKGTDMLGERVRALREARSWTQAHLAEAAGVSLRTVQRLETLDSCAPETLLAVAAVLEVDVRMLRDPSGADRAGAVFSWPSPSPALAWKLGALLTLPSFGFVVVNLLRSQFGVAQPYESFAALIGTSGLARPLEWASPALLLGDPLLALLVGLAAQVRPLLRRSRGGFTLVAVDLRPRVAALSTSLVALGSLMALSAYAILENLAALR